MPVPEIACEDRLHFLLFVFPAINFNNAFLHAVWMQKNIALGRNQLHGRGKNCIHIATTIYEWKCTLNYFRAD